MLRQIGTNLFRKHYFYHKYVPYNNAWVLRKKSSDVDGNYKYSFPSTTTAFKKSSSRYGNFRIINVDDDNMKLTIQHPGLAYDDYDYNGVPKFWKIMKMLESVVFFSHETPLDDTMRSFKDFTKLGQECLLVTVSAQISTTKSMYDSGIPKFPLIFTVEGGYVGKSSVSIVCTLYTEKDHIELCENVTHFVSVDKIKYQKKPLPDWWREKYLQAGHKKHPLKFDKLTKPDDYCVNHSVVLWSDTNFDNHISTCGIGHIIEDGLQFSAERKMIPFNCSNFKNGLSRLCLSVYGASKPGDDLYVNMWMQQDCDRTVYFDVQNNGQTIAQCSTLYH